MDSDSLTLPMVTDEAEADVDLVAVAAGTVAATYSSCRDGVSP